MHYKILCKQSTLQLQTVNTTVTCTDIPLVGVSMGVVVGRGAVEEGSVSKNITHSHDCIYMYTTLDQCAVLQSCYIVISVGKASIMKGTKVLTLGAGRGISYTHARYCYWWAGALIFIQLVVAYHLAKSLSLACYTTR